MLVDEVFSKEIKNDYSHQGRVTNYTESNTFYIESRKSNDIQDVEVNDLNNDFVEDKEAYEGSVRAFACQIPYKGEFDIVDLDFNILLFFCFISLLNKS